MISINVKIEKISIVFFVVVVVFFCSFLIFRILWVRFFLLFSKFLSHRVLVLGGTRTHNLSDLWANK